MEQRDRLEFIKRLQFCPDHPTLNGERNDQQHVVTGKAPDAGAWHGKNGGEEQADKQTGTGFLDAEVQELDQKS